MNRTWPSSKPVHPAPEAIQFSLDAGRFSTPDHETAHALFAPLHYERGYSYPLIVWLHGQGSDERHLLRVMPAVSMRNYLAVAPRGTDVDAKRGYGWSQSQDQVQEAEQRILDCIELVGQKFHVAQRRIFLAGFDCGGTMAFRVAMNRPDRFAGIISLGGAFPAGHTPFANLPQARQLPVFLAAGRASEAYPDARVCDDLRLLHAAGLSITLRVYPCGHELSPQMLADVDRWIIDQITSGNTLAAQSDEVSSREIE
jgi:phospholipase/carboxylesterase